MIRIMTYNAHRCVGGDGRYDPTRIAAVIAESAPDIVALQELDVARPRSGGVDQARAIAHALEMTFHFHPALRVEEELYGDAILTALPSRLVKADPLPGLPWPSRLEPRGALWVEIEAAGRRLQVINTHLGLLARERRAQVAALLGRGWLGHPDCRDPVVLLGDFNAVPRSGGYRALTRQLRDAQLARAGLRPAATFPALFPVLRLDHVFLRGDVRVVNAEVPRSVAARAASDHLPLVVDLELGAG